MNRPRWYSLWQSKRQNNQWAKKATKKLKRIKPKQLAELADEVHDEFFDQHDCLDCANCCTTLPVLLTPKDSQRLAKLMQLSLADFETQYTLRDDDGDVVLKEKPCPFLDENNACKIYEDRPTACRDFPHTDGYQLVETLQYQAKNVKHCPASYAILEQLNRRV